MKIINNLIIIPFALVLIVGCSTSNSGESSENEGFEGSSEGGSGGSHYQGQNCMNCHSSGENRFSSGATIFTSLHASNSTANTASNYTIRLRLSSGGTVNYNRGRGSGNAWVSTNTGAINSFTVEIVNAQNTVVNSSASNSHTVGRLACNSCHTSTGANGAPGRIVNYRY